jgi:predicted TIM-barrel fold metal-dependent hydrolase
MENTKKDFFGKIFLLLGLVFLAYFVSLSSNTSNIPAIDVHEHIMLNNSETAKLIAIMDQLNISKMVLLDTPGITFGTSENFTDYDENIQIQLKMKSLYPGRFLVLYTFPPWDKDGPSKIEEYYKQGIDGLKFYNGVIYDLLGPINSSQMHAAYQKARELNLPVTIHVEALDEEQFAEFEQVLNDFPDVIFICPHLCGSAENLTVLDSMFAQHKNLYADSGPWSRVGKYAVKNPETFRQFFINHSDRIMYATDIVRADDVNSNINMTKWFKCDRDLLERIDFLCFKEKGWLKGMHLPENVLKNIYEINPKKVYRNA